MRPLHALLLFLCLFLASPRAHADSVAVEAIASLADPAKLATLGERQANPRVQKITYWLATARAGGERPDAVIDSALARFGWKGTPRGDLTKAAMLRNLDIAEKLGCLDQNGLEQMRGGRSPIVRRGPYTGDKLSVDHIIPFAVMPELDHVLANLELMPLRMNESKNALVGDRQVDLARRFEKAGLLAPEAPQPSPAPAKASALQPQPPPRLTATVEAYQNALRRFPELGTANTPLNRAFVERVTKLRTERPEAFRNPEWPVTIAAQVFAEMNQAAVPPASPVTVATPAKPALPAATRVPSSPVSSPASSGGYVGSEKSEVFHKAGCKGASTILPKNLVTYASREAAVEAGKRPCGICKP